MTQPTVQPEQRMLHSDAFAWYMEKDPALRSTVVAIIRLDRGPDWERLRARHDRLTRLVPKLRMRVQVPPLRIGPPRWTVDEQFDLDFHLRRARLSTGGGWPEVLEFARTRAMSDFDRARPLWEFTLLEGLPDGGAALVSKLHHSLADGIGGMQLAALVIDPGPEEVPLGPLPPAPEGRARSFAELTAQSLLDDARDGATAVRRVLGALPGALVGAVRDPLGATRSAVATTTSVARFVAPINTQLSPLLGERHIVRRLDTLDVPFAALHAAAAAAGGHVNDAYLAALTEAMRLYHERRGTRLPELRFTVPVSVRHSGDAIGGNRITLIRIKAPVIPGRPDEQIRALTKIMYQWRHEPALGHTQEIAFGLNLLPRSYIGGIFKRVEMLGSDVPGLPQQVWLAGARVTGYYGFGPTIGSGFNATLMSYAGTCNIGVNIDTSAIDDPDALLECLREGFDAVLALSPAERGPSRPTPAATADGEARPRAARTRTDGARAARTAARPAAAAPAAPAAAAGASAKRVTGRDATVRRGHATPASPR